MPGATQVFILDAMASYVPMDPQQAESIVQRVLPRLQHANGAVVLSAVKVIGLINEQTAIFPTIILPAELWIQHLGHESCASIDCPKD